MSHQRDTTFQESTTHLIGTDQMVVNLTDKKSVWHTGKKMKHLGHRGDYELYKCPDGHIGGMLSGAATGAFAGWMMGGGAGGGFGGGGFGGGGGGGGGAGR